jgi:nicotinamide-nucleotide amidase
MKKFSNQIAVLCTGDEIVNGDVIDTNAPYMAQQLIDHNFQPGTRMAVADNQTHLQNAIRYLLQDHAVLITIGGLGPTSDDLTRFAMSAALNKPLQFDEASWQRIVDRFQQYQREITDNNRQQCQFPQGAEIYPNPNGTASACCVPYGQQLIFMLPGPPNECRPIFDTPVLGRLKKTRLVKKYHRRSWMLFHVSESSIAALLDPIVTDSACDLAYRVTYPYLQVKLKSDDKIAIDSIANEINHHIGENCISQTQQTGSQQFVQCLHENRPSITITDKATHGALANQLLSPDNHDYLSFNPQPADYHVLITGLQAYWQQEKSDTDKIVISIHYKDELQSKEAAVIPMRGDKTLCYTIELICLHLLKHLPTNH